jgi:hypothetical protein
MATALECFDIGLKVNPNNPRVIFKRAVALLGNPLLSGEGKMSVEEVRTFQLQQIAAIDQAISIDPTEVSFYIGKAGTLASMDGMLN